MTEKTPWEVLSRIDVTDKIEKKNGLSYLSWAWAWAVTKRECPDATYKLLPTEYDEALGFMVHTEVTIEGETLPMWLPVMDGANKSMLKTSQTYSTRYGDKQVDAATTFDINKTLMRCLVKNLAMFGLGIYIYAGEDLPEAEVSTPAPAKAKPTSNLIDLAVDDANWNGVVKYAKDNKALGFDKIGQQLSRKYNLSNEVKQALVDLLK